MVDNFLTSVVFCSLQDWDTEVKYLHVVLVHFK